MKIKAPTPFLTFCDGACDVYSVVGNRTSEKLFSLPYGRRTAGIQRFYEARAAGVKLDVVIHVPLHGKIIPAENRVGLGNQIYSIVQIQELRDTNPPAYLLSLQKLGAKL